MRLLSPCDVIWRALAVLFPFLIKATMRRSQYETTQATIEDGWPDSLAFRGTSNKHACLLMELSRKQIALNISRSADLPSEYTHP